MRVYRWKQVVTYTVEMLDVGEISQETGEAFKTVEEVDEAAKEWLESAMPVEYYPEEFVTIEAGELEFLGVEIVATQEPSGAPE